MDRRDRHGHSGHPTRVRKPCLLPTVGRAVQRVSIESSETYANLSIGKRGRPSARYV